MFYPEDTQKKSEEKISYFRLFFTWSLFFLT